MLKDIVRPYKTLINVVLKPNDHGFLRSRAKPTQLLRCYDAPWNEIGGHARLPPITNA